MQHRLLKSLSVFLILIAACSSDPEPNQDVGLSDTRGDVAVLDDAQHDAGTPEDVQIDADGEEPDMSRTIFEQGPYNIGHRRWNITYESQVYGERTLRLSVWYPTLDQEGTPSAYFGSFRRDVAFRDASVALTEPAPMLVFSHGNASIAEQSYFMTEYFASHGWVVAAPYHTLNTIGDTEGSINFESGGMRPQDISAVIDVMLSLPSDDPLAGLVSDKIVLTGHSFGGFTTLANSGAEFAVDEVLQFCAEPNAPRECEMFERDGVEALMRAGFLDERIDAAIPQTPGGYFVFGDGLAAIDTPTLLFTGAMDITLPPEEEGEPIWAAMQGPHMRVDVTRAGHFTFSNMCELIPVAQVYNDGCSPAFIPYQEAFPLINAFSMAFSKYVLFGDEEGLDLLRGVDTRWADEVVLDYKVDSPLAP